APQDPRRAPTRAIRAMPLRATSNPARSCEAIENPTSALKPATARRIRSRPDRTEHESIQPRPDPPAHRASPEPPAAPQAHSRLNPTAPLPTARPAAERLRPVRSRPRCPPPRALEERLLRSTQVPAWSSLTLGHHALANMTIALQ